LYKYVYIDFYNEAEDLSYKLKFVVSKIYGLIYKKKLYLSLNY